MPSRLPRLALAGSLAATLAACSYSGFSYTSERYGLVRPVNVTLRCRDTYEVLDRPDAASLIVVTNGANEILAACSDGPGESLPERQRAAARIFLDEKSNRPGCRIVGEQELSASIREISYRCPDDPALASPRLRLPPGRTSRS